jgi:hypothetical protein
MLGAEWPLFGFSCHKNAFIIHRQLAVLVYLGGELNFGFAFSHQTFFKLLPNR